MKTLLRRLAGLALALTLAGAAITPVAASIAPPGSYCQGLYTTWAITGLHWTMGVAGSLKSGDYEQKQWGCFDNYTSAWPNLDYAPNPSLIKLSGQTYQVSSAGYDRFQFYKTAGLYYAKFRQYAVTPWFNLGTWSCRGEFTSDVELDPFGAWKNLHYSQSIQLSGNPPLNWGSICVLSSGLFGTFPPSPYSYFVSAG